MNQITTNNLDAINQSFDSYSIDDGLKTVFLLANNRFCRGLLFRLPRQGLSIQFTVMMMKCSLQFFFMFVLCLCYVCHLIGFMQGRISVGVALPWFQVRQGTREWGQRSHRCSLSGCMQIDMPRWCYAVAQTSRYHQNLAHFHFLPSGQSPLPLRREDSFGWGARFDGWSHRIVHPTAPWHGAVIGPVTCNDGTPSECHDRLCLVRFAIETGNRRKLSTGHLDW